MTYRGRELAKRLFAALLLCGVFSKSIAQTDNLYNGKGLLDFRDPPFKIAVHQAYPEFWTHLERLNSEYEVLDLDQDWHPFADADVFVLALESKDDLPFVPGFFERIMTASMDLTFPDFAQGTTYGFRGQSYFLLVTIRENLSEEAKSDVGCLTATALIDGIIVFPDDELDQLYSNCK